MDDRSGIVFQTIHGSFVDGYGVRTTVFLKGCPLRCAWCCNPESQLAHPELKFTASQCTGCGRCLPACPTGAISIAPDSVDGKVQIARGVCTNCGDCIAACYTGALDLFGKRMTVDELFDVVKKDEAFYRTSSGGVSIGGGEPTQQAHFVRALIKKCKEHYIHTALDTCGCTSTEDGMAALEEADLLLYDLKGVDPERHRQGTGVSNELILRNLRRLSDSGRPIIIRMPLVPGYNDSEEEIISAADFLSQLRSIERVDLMAYHEYGTVKYAQLGRVYRPRGTPISPERLERIKSILEQRGLRVQFGG